MANNSNLVPVPITDKNGKRTTVHRKVKSESSLKKGLPAPVRDPYMSEARKAKMAEREVLREKVLELVGDPTTTGPTNPKPLARELSLINGTEHLQRVLAIAEAIKEDSKPEHQKGYEFWKFADSIRNRKHIDIAYEHIELVRKSTKMTDGFSSIVHLYEEIAAKFATDDDPEPVIHHMNKHLYAYMALKDNEFYGSSSHMGYYVDKYSTLVSKHTERVEQLCAYLIERGGLEGFDEAGFNEYLSTHASLAEGVL